MKKLSLILLLVVSGWLFVSANFALAETGYVLLAPIPLNGVEAGDTPSATASFYIKGIFRLLIGIAGVLAVVYIVIGGIKYMSTDAFGGKAEAKGTIQNAVGGLLLALGAWVILNTISPNLVNFNLSIERLKTVPQGTIGVGGLSGGPSGGRGARCLGDDCTHSYNNASGNIVNYKDCSSCTSANNLGLNIKNPVVNGTSAQINTALGTRLQGTQGTPGTPSFQVTETWPPTVNHLSQEQYDGTSVDVKLLKPSADNINTFINNAEKNGLRVVYEVSNSTQKKAYIDAGVPDTKIIVANITGEHFSVYKK